MRTLSLLLVGLSCVLFTSCASRQRTVVVDRPGGTVVRHVEVRRAPPPAPRVVVRRPAAPGPTHVWVAGHHVVRRGAYVWVPGAWRVPPRAGVAWVPGRYRRGVWVRGAWR